MFTGPTGKPLTEHPRCVLSPVNAWEAHSQSHQVCRIDPAEGHNPFKVARQVAPLMKPLHALTIVDGNVQVDVTFGVLGVRLQDASHGLVKVRNGARGVAPAARQQPLPEERRTLGGRLRRALVTARVRGGGGQCADVLAGHARGGRLHGHALVDVGQEVALANEGTALARRQEHDAVRLGCWQHGRVAKLAGIGVLHGCQKRGALVSRGDGVLHGMRHHVLGGVERADLNADLVVAPPHRHLQEDDEVLVWELLHLQSEGHLLLLASKVREQELRGHGGRLLAPQEDRDVRGVGHDGRLVVRDGLDGQRLRLHDHRSPPRGPPRPWAADMGRYARPAACLERQLGRLSPQALVAERRAYPRGLCHERVVHHPLVEGPDLVEEGQVRGGAPKSAELHLELVAARVLGDVGPEDHAEGLPLRGAVHDGSLHGHFREPLHRPIPVRWPLNPHAPHPHLRVGCRLEARAVGRESPGDFRVLHQHDGQESTGRVAHGVRHFPALCRPDALCARGRARPEHASVVAPGCPELPQRWVQ
mmetsp:Transcript_43574/g.125778  ORF Transcript_43574/g.125778 Transcript_43574/m.125778 type:complete len:533 (+) Transcript_43574:76-1674(+)